MEIIKRNEVWNYISGIGELILEEYLVVAEEPLLFVCRKKEGVERYLVLNYDEEEFVYIISRVKPQIICEMLEDRITMQEAFCSTEEIYVTQGTCNHITYASYDPKTFPEDMLPEKGVFFGLKLDYIERYKAKLKQEALLIFQYSIFRDRKSSTVNMNIDYSWKLKDELDHKSGDDYLNTISGNDRFFMVNNRIHVA